MGGVRHAYSIEVGDVEWRGKANALMFLISCLLFLMGADRHQIGGVMVWCLCSMKIFPLLKKPLKDGVVGGVLVTARVVEGFTAAIRKPSFCAHEPS